LLKKDDLITKLRGCKTNQSAIAVISQTIQDEAA
jgi:hypothetical protein